MTPTSKPQQRLLSNYDSYAQEQLRDRHCEEKAKDIEEVMHDA